MSFATRSGCPMCSIVASTSPMSHGPRSPSFPSGSTAPEIIWKDENFTAYREKAHPVSSKGHIIIVFNLHVSSLYSLSTSDIPLLVELRTLATRLLSNLTVPSSDHWQSSRISTTSPSLSSPPSSSTNLFKIGFITSPFKDSKIPVTDHLHAHTYIAPSDLCGWWRGLAFGPLGWYALDDLIAEIRESSSNNRVKSGYENRQNAPIDKIPQAGATFGTADGKVITDQSLLVSDLESSDLERADSVIYNMIPRDRNAGVAADSFSTLRLQGY